MLSVRKDGRAPAEIATLPGSQGDVSSASYTSVSPLQPAPSPRTGPLLSNTPAVANFALITRSLQSACFREGI